MHYDWFGLYFNCVFDNIDTIYFEFIFGFYFSDVVSDVRGGERGDVVVDLKIRKRDFGCEKLFWRRFLMKIKGFVANFRIQNNFEF